MKTPLTLRDGYHYYNRLLFDDTLPIVPVKWRLLDGIGGSTHGKIRFDRKTPDEQTLIAGSLHIRVSSRYRRNNRVRDQILIHEMIHILMYSTGRFSECHGSQFQDEVRRCEAIVGFALPHLTLGP